MGNRGRGALIVGGLLAITIVHAARAEQDAASQPTPTLAEGVFSPAPLTPAQVSPEGQRSIEHGTRWLLSTMRPDGSISGDIGERPDLSCTAMAGLALVSQGNTPRGGPHSEELSRITDAVLNMVDSIPPGEIHYRQVSLVQRKIGRNADRFLAALFLSQVLGESGDADADVRFALDKLVTEICRTQGPDGTGGSESWAPVLGTVLGWESLRAAHSCGLKVEASAKLVGEALREHLKKSMGSSSEGWMHDFYKDASIIRVLHSMGYRSDPAFKTCVERTLRFAKHDSRPFQLAGGEEYLGFFLVTECFLQQPEAESQEWYPVVSKRIVDQQNADGSWSGHHCITDRTFCTAAALLTLQSANYCLPISNL
jgi:hypothetical protein